MYFAEPIKSSFSLGLGVCVCVCMCVCVCVGGEKGVASHTKPHTKHFDTIFCPLLSSFLTLLYSSTLVLFGTIFDS